MKKFILILLSVVALATMAISAIGAEEYPVSAPKLTRDEMIDRGEFVSDIVAHKPMTSEERAYMAEVEARIKKDKDGNPISCCETLPTNEVSSKDIHYYRHDGYCVEVEYYSDKICSNCNRLVEANILSSTDGSCRGTHIKDGKEVPTAFTYINGYLAGSRAEIKPYVVPE